MSHAEPLVSILVPAYNPRFFEHALASALAQDYGNVEILVCDDSAGDDIQQVCARLGDDRVQYVWNPTNLGFSGNFTNCFNRARGEYLKFLNDDDVLDPTCVSRMVHEFGTRGDTVTLVTSRRLLIDAHGAALPDGPANTPVAPVTSFIDGRTLANSVLVRSVNVIGEPTTVMFRKRDLDIVGDKLFELNGVGYTCFADVSVWLRLLSKGGAVYIAEPLSRCRIHAGQEQRKPAVAMACLTERLDLVAAGVRLGFLDTPDLYAQAMRTVARMFRSRLSSPRFDAAARAQLGALLGEIPAQYQQFPNSAHGAVVPVAGSMTTTLGTYARVGEGAVRSGRRVVSTARRLAKAVVRRLTMSRVDRLMASGRVHLRHERPAEAERCFRQVLVAKPAHAPAYEGLGASLLQSRRRDEAAAALWRSIELNPSVDAYLNLGVVMRADGNRVGCVDVLRQAAAAFPDDLGVAAAFARALQKNNQFDEAAETFERALARWPSDPVLLYYFGNLLFFQARIARVIELYRQCLRVHPESVRIHSALLFTLHFLPGVTSEDLLVEHREWDRVHAAPLRNGPRSFTNDPAPDRRIRVGYVSGDFKDCSVGRFIRPVLAGHDRHQFEVFAYYDTLLSDAFTERIRGSVDRWRHVPRRSHEQFAEMIRADRIDILVDLSMHTAVNRLPVFARRAAPVQVTYLAYCSTTGLADMDYRLSDPGLDPPGWESRYVERTVRLPSFWLYEAPADAPDVAPRGGGEGVVFSCLNSFAKASDPALQTWASILKAVPGSRLLLHCPPGQTRRRIADVMGQMGIAPERVEFSGMLPMEKYLAQYQGVDIALDPFPYAGGTTTCDALWMGVPVVTLAGELAVGRGSGSILANLGLPELIAPTRAGYVDCAVSWARDAHRRAALRATLRERMKASPVMDTHGFMNGLETAYRTMWREWCR